MQKNNLTSHPQKIKSALESAIYITKVAFDTPNITENEAVELIQMVRHLTHLNMPGGGQTGKSSISLESNQDLITNYIKAHARPYEGLKMLRYKYNSDPSYAFMKTGELALDTKSLVESPETFVADNMHIRPATAPCFINKVRVSRYMAAKKKPAC